MKTTSQILLASICGLAAACTLATAGDTAPPAELIFQSGFEPDSHIIPRGADVDIAGIDHSVAAPNDWIQDFDGTPDRGQFVLQYQGGEPDMRDASIIPEPGNPDNHVLRFWLNAPNVEGKKGRVQANIYHLQKGLKEFYQSVRVYLSEDFNTARTYPDSFHWLTLAEWWNNITWGPEVSNAARVTLGIGKPTTGEGPLRFIVDGQDFTPGIPHPYKTIWAEANETVDVPIGQWFTLEYYYKEGDAEHGRFYMTIQPEGEERQVVFDLTRVTQNTQDPNPDGVTDFSPMKLYTSAKLIQHLHSQGKAFEVYWDDFKLWENRRP